MLAALLIGVVSNLDNLGVGVAFGIRGTKIDAMANLIVAGLTVAATAAAVTCGHLLSKILPSAVTGWLGPLIIIAIGIGTALPSVRTSRPPGPSQVPSGAWRHPRGVDEIISWRQAIVLGIALAANNLGTGVGAGVAGVPASPTIVSAGLLSLVALGGGSRFGSRFGRLVLGRYAPQIAGVLLLAVGAAMLRNVH